MPGMTKNLLGERIGQARKSAGMTQDQVAQRLKVSRSTIAQVELGNRGVTALELDHMAYLFGMDAKEFFETDFREPDAMVALFRAQPELAGENETAEALRKSLALAHELTNLEWMLGLFLDRPPLASYPVVKPTTKWEAIKQGERSAGEERRRLDLGTTPISDVAELLETQGVRTALVDMPEDISGLALSDARIGTFVAANRLHHALRRRFSLAHEYAHVLMDRDRGGTISREVDRDDLREVRANAFAAAFLLPEAGLRQFVASLGKGRPSRMTAEVFDEKAATCAEARTEPGSQDIRLYDVIQVAHYFGVSRATALYRLRNLRIITETELDDLMKEDQSKGRKLAGLLEIPEPGHSAARNEFRHRFLGLALEALRREIISEDKLRELGRMVDVDDDRIRELLLQAGVNDTRQNGDDVKGGGA
jgi:Zn-dependent peptidase ImmA (M78 family)/DNA-binding XRE family transcriptional regulator